MSQEFRDYKRYVTDERWAAIYSDYQKKYAVEPRESDKVSARLVREAVAMMALKRPPRILDIGCSTGNFLRLLKATMPHADLTGGDLMIAHQEQCKRDGTLEGIDFELMDILDLPKNRPFDVIVANAVNVYFDPLDYERAAKSIRAALAPYGAFVAFELVFPGNKERRVIEPSDAHPEGLKVELRSQRFVTETFLNAGFSEVVMTPFEIPIDLPKPEPSGTDAELISWTETDALTGRRLLWRGIGPDRWYQPWTHIVAKKSA